jgi:hypothetical protein
MATIRFFTRTITKDKNTLVPIYIRLKHGRKIDIVCKSDIYIKPENWSNETQQARQRADIFKFKTGKSESSGRKKFNDRIDKLRSFIETNLEGVNQSDLISKLNNKDPENRKVRNKALQEWLKVLIDKYWHPEKYEENLFTYIQNFIDNSDQRKNIKTGRPVCYKMQREYEVTFDYLKKYAEKIGKKIDFKDINMDFYNGFTQYLQDEELNEDGTIKKKKLSVNTIGKKIQTLKIFLNSAKENSKNNFDLYKSKNFATISEVAETIYLNEDELTKIYNKDFSKNPGMDRVRDLFLIGCWTGCRFSDIEQITPDSISGGFIHIKQYKTGTKVIIPLYPVVTAILNKYNGKLPKAISNQKFNETLKDIARLSEINERTHKAITRGGINVSKVYEKWQLCSTHTARRSFSTNLYLQDFPSLSIMAITGHKTEKAFLKYIKVTPDEHARKLQDHWNKRHLKVV